MQSERVRTYLSFVARTLFCEIVRRPENKYEGADRFAYVTSRSLPSVQNYRPCIVFSGSMQKYEHPLRLTYFLFIAGYRNLHTSVFSGNLLTLSANRNICHSNHRQWVTFSPSSFIFLFPVKPLCRCYLMTALNRLSSSPALGRELR